MTTLLVNEAFETIQGEGSFTGTPAIFVRLQGCPVGCSWCDTKHTWDVLPSEKRDANVILQKTLEAPTYFETTSAALLDLFKQQAYRAKHIVITGGEPCMFDLRELTTMAIDKSYSVQIETSGTFEVKCHPKTWVTVSPKINMKANMPVLSQAMKRANEIKHPVAMQKHVEELEALLEREGMLSNGCGTTEANTLIYLQPISQQDRATELAVKTCIEKNWRLSIQVHKYIGVE
jgi:7-carboxy-7-deazaguanine synthase